MLHAYCLSIKDRFPSIEWCVGIAMEPPKHYRNKITSEDMIYIEFANFSDEEFAEAKKVREEFGIANFPDEAVIRSSEKEFPKKGQIVSPGMILHTESGKWLDPSNPNSWGKIPRNAKCPCGSDTKYKKCHGKA